MLAEDELDQSILAAIGGAICWIFAPLGFGTWEATVASITGLVAKENIVGTMGILYGASGDLYATLGIRIHSGKRICVPRIQPALRSMLRSNRCNQARDE